MRSPYSKERLAGLEAVLWAIDNRRELEELALESADQAELIASLKRLHHFDDSQCDFVISLSAGHMTKKYRVQMSEERKQLREELANGS